MYRLLIILVGLLWTVLNASAADSIWYSNGDPLWITDELYSNSPQQTLPCAGIEYQKPLTLTDVTEAALCNNPQTHEAYANAKVQVAQLGIAKSAYLPTVSDSVGVNENYTNTPSATRGRNYYNLSNNLVASYLLYDFGNRNASLENARQLLQAASATQNVTVQKVLLAAIKAYYQVQTDIAALKATEVSEHFFQESFNAATAKYKAGVSTPADKLQAQTALAQAALNRITAEGVLRTDYGVLANVMGLAANTAVTLANTEVPAKIPAEVEYDIQQLIEQAHHKRPDLLASEAQLSAAKANVEASRAAAKPTVSIGVSDNLSDGSDLTTSHNAALGVTVSIPIFTGYAPTYKIRAAEAVADVRAAQREQLRLQISLDVWTAFQNLRTVHEAIKSAEVLVDSAKESARVALGRYKAGVGNIIDTLNAQNALASAEQQKIKADLNLNIARVTLAQSMGLLDHVMIQALPDAD